MNIWQFNSNKSINHADLNHGQDVRLLTSMTMDCVYLTFTQSSKSNKARDSVTSAPQFAHYMVNKN